MNGAIFGPIKGTLVDLFGLVGAALLGYWINRHATRLWRLEEYLHRLPAWVKRFPVGSPAFLLAVRVIPGFGGTVATASAAAFRVPVWVHVWTMCAIALAYLRAADDLRRPRDGRTAWLRSARPSLRASLLSDSSMSALSFPSLETTSPAPVTTPEIVAGAAALEKVCARVADAQRVGLDTEFHAERTYSPRLMVVQLAFDDGAAIVDALGGFGPARAGTRAHSYDRGRTRVLGRPKDLCRSLRRCAAARLRYVKSRPRSLVTACRYRLADLVRTRLRRAAREVANRQRLVGPAPYRSARSNISSATSRICFALYDALRPRLEERGRYEWVYEECAELGDIERYRIDERRAYLRIPGAMRMSRRELAHSQRAREVARSRCSRSRLAGAIRFARRRRRRSGRSQTSAHRRISRHFAGSMQRAKRQLGGAILACRRARSVP